LTGALVRGGRKRKWRRGIFHGAEVRLTHQGRR
jgi:hypothetical protein